MADSKTPTAFISYSWSTASYAERVEQLARDLANVGIRVLLDQWDLREGQDKHAFMEKCVSDPEVDRVLILIDPRYVERANRREGGVGTETLIISGEVYAAADQHKFIAVVMERDQDGKIILPIYLKDRIYVDLSDPESYADQYERLIRNLHGKPLRNRPQLGEMPTYLNDGAVTLETGQSLSMFRQALTQDRHNQIGYLDDYLARFAAAFEKGAVETPDNVAELELRVSNSIDGFLPYREEFVDLLTALGRYGERPDLYGKLHSFFERLTTFRMTRPQRWSSDIETENLSFLIWEMFLYTIGTLLRSNRLRGVERVLRPYYVRSRLSADGVLREFDIIEPGFRLLQEQRQKRLNTRYYSAAGQLLFERVTSVPFEVLTEADSVLWVRSVLTNEARWWPHTAIYRQHQGFSDLPVWSRARGDRAYFGELAPILGVGTLDEVVSQLNKLDDSPLYHVSFMRLDRRTIAHMLGIQDRLTVR